jgi:hypothetical protein
MSGVNGLVPKLDIPYSPQAVIELQLALFVVFNFVFGT